MAGRTGLRLRTGLCARTGACFADRAALELEFLAAAKGRFLKRQRQVILQITAALGRILASAAAAASAKTAAREHIKDILKPAEAAKAASAASTAAHGGIVEAELVIARALLRIAEHFVGFVNFLEARLSLLVVRVKIRMAGLGRLAVSLFDFVIRSALATPSTS